jgi:hypothetical protein
MNKWGLRLLRACGVAVWPFALIFVGGFPIRQGAVLGLLIVWLWYGVGHAGVEPTRRLIPYWVEVSPNWCQILTDFRLIGSLDEWHSIQESVMSSVDPHILLVGVHFTVVQKSEDLKRTLIFSRGHFQSRLDFQWDISPIQIEDSRRDLSYQRAELFMKPARPPRVVGYDLGIRVPYWWWEKVKGSCPVPLDEDHDRGTGYVGLALATLPLKEFDSYWELVNWTGEYILKTRPQIRKRRDEARQELGWTAENHYIPELGSGGPEHITHKYFGVMHHQI